MLDTRRTQTTARRNATVTPGQLLTRIAASQILPPALVRAGRSRAIAAVVAHAGAGLPLRVLTLVADAGLVLFAIDDLLDDPELAAEEGRLRVAQYAAVARGESLPEVAFDPIARALTALRQRLAEHDRAGDLVDAWADAVGRMLAGMGAELDDDASGAAGLPRYLASGRDSIGVEMVALAAWIATDAAGTRAALPALRRAERSFSTAVRLANDLRTCERERAEGRVNAVTLVGESGRPLLCALRDRALADGRRALAHGGVADTAQGRFVERFADAIVSMYVTRDFEQAA
ncbi:MAG: terpene synthase family protein [Polyangiales bacterium]